MTGQVLVIGSDGQLARALKPLLPEASFIGRSVLDLAHPERVEEVLTRYNPSAIINAAAYTQVDNAESEEALAAAVNAHTPGAIAQYCAARVIPFVHVSTDYVFDGSGGHPHKEDEAVAPLNAYGRSKLAGENAITQAGGEHLICRTSWVYDDKGKNFFNTILRLASEREELKIIDDQFGAPTYAPHLAKALVDALASARAKPGFPHGIYHLCNRGVTTWFGFATAIVEQARKRGLPLKVKAIHPIKAVEYPLPAKRPYNSRLDCSKAKTLLGVELPSWEEGLSACMESKYDRQ